MASELALRQRAIQMKLAGSRSHVRPINSFSTVIKLRFLTPLMSTGTTLNILRLPPMGVPKSSINEGGIPAVANVCVLWPPIITQTGCGDPARPSFMLLLAYLSGLH